MQERFEYEIESTISFEETMMLLFLTIDKLIDDGYIEALIVIDTINGRDYISCVGNKDENEYAIRVVGNFSNLMNCSEFIKDQIKIDSERIVEASNGDDQISIELGSRLYYEDETLYVELFWRESDYTL